MMFWGGERKSTKIQCGESRHGLKTLTLGRVEISGKQKGEWGKKSSEKADECQTKVSPGMPS